MAIARRSLPEVSLELSFWDFATPADVAELLRRSHGPAGRGVAVQCSVAAKSDGRDKDYRFWLAVECELSAEGPASADALQEQRH